MCFLKIKGPIFPGGQSQEIRSRELEFKFCYLLKTFRYGHLKRFSNSKMQNFLRQSNQGGLSTLIFFYKQPRYKQLALEASKH